MFNHAVLRRPASCFGRRIRSRLPRRQLRLFPFVHGDPLANQFDGPFLVRLIRKEVTHISGFPFGIESRDRTFHPAGHSGTMRRSLLWSIPCHNQAYPLPTNDTPASRPTGAESVAMKWARFPNLAPDRQAELKPGPYPSACSSRAAGVGRGLDEPNQRMDVSSRPQPGQRGSPSDRRAARIARRNVLASETIATMHLSGMRPAPKLARAQLAGGVGAERTANVLQVRRL